MRARRRANDALRAAEAAYDEAVVAAITARALIADLGFAAEFGAFSDDRAAISARIQQARDALRRARAELGACALASEEALR